MNAHRRVFLLCLKKINMVKLRYIYILVLTLVLISCQKERESTEESGRGTISFYLPGSRSTQENNRFESGDAIGVFAIDSQTGSYWASNNKYVYNGTTFKPATREDNIILTKGQSLKIYAYYPYLSDQTDPENIYHQVGNQSEKASWLSADFMTAVYSGLIKSYEIPLHFYRQNSTVEITVKRNDGVTGATLYGVSFSGGYNLLHNTVNVGSEKKNVAMYRFSDTGETTVFRATVPVQPLLPSVNYILLSGSNDVKLNASSGIVLKPGIVHPFSLDYKKKITVNNYEPGGIATGGGLYSLGSNCTLTASPSAGYEFAGWYDSSGLIESGNVYSFPVMGDRVLEARYRNFSSWNISVTADPLSIPVSGGLSSLSVSATRDIYINGTQVLPETITAPDHRISLTSNNPAFRIEGTSVRVSENTTTSDRTATITATVGTESASVVLSQSGRRETYIFTVDGGSSATASFSSRGGNKKFSIASYRIIEADGVSRQENVLWTSSQFSFGTLLPDGTLHVRENTSKTPVVGAITLTQEGSNKQVRINVLQTGQSEIIISPR